MKTILITGCSSGFGRAAAAYFLERDWNVVATMRTPKYGDDLQESERLRILPLDVTKRASVDQAVSGAITDFGAIDAVVNNAGIGLLSAFEVTPDKVTRELFETNVFGLMSVCQAVIPHFRERRAGVLVNVTSSVFFMPMGMVAPYTASKFAAEGFTESLAYELSAFGIRTKIVEPGYAPTTSFTPNGMDRMKGLISEPYAPYAQEIFSSKLGEQTTQAIDVARAVWEAVHDSGPRLRYPAGADAVASAELRRTHPGESYLDEIRPMLAPKKR